MKPYVRSDLLSVLKATPEQTPWDVDAWRRGAEELFGAACAKPAQVMFTNEQEQGKAPVPLRVFMSDQPRAVVLSIHGGGYMAGKAEYDDAKNAELSKNLNALVASPEYRLAPEHPLPAGIEDCSAALRWCAQQAQRMNVPLYVFGDSAGGGLAFFSAVQHNLAFSAIKVDGERGACLPERISSAAHDGFAEISGVILLEPCLDPRTQTPSFTTYADGPIWTARAGKVAWEASAISDNVRESLVDMLENKDYVANFPATFIVVNPADPLRDEGINLAQHLADCGVQTELHMFAGTFHGALSVRRHPVWGQIQTMVAGFMEE